MTKGKETIMEKVIVHLSAAELETLIRSHRQGRECLAGLTADGKPVVIRPWEAPAEDASMALREDGAGEAESVFPPGPALIYVPSDLDLLGEASAVRVDRGTGVLEPGGRLSEEDAERERALLRALLAHTMAMLSRTERAR